jgi:hypothetical protein
MKKMRLIFASAFVAFLGLTSCEDAYNIEQPGELNEESLTTVEDMQAYLNAGVYASLSNSSEIAFTAIFTDETGVGTSNGGSDLDTHRFLVNSDNGYAFGIWYGHYGTINRVNRLLRIANRIGVPTDPTELATYNAILGQARAARAYSYLQLMAFYSPNMTDDSAEGVMFLGDNVPGAGDDYPKSTNGEIFTAMEADLDYAYDNVTSTDYKYITKNMVNALRARMYLYRGNFTLAKQYALAVINTPGLSLTAATPVPANAPTNPAVGAANAWNVSFYGNSSTNPYRRMFADLAQGEVIFALARPSSGSWENLAANFTQNTTTASGSPRWEVSRALFNKFTQVPGDVRRYVNVDPTSVINANYDQPNVDYIATDRLIIDKYPGKTGAVLRNDAKIFRVSEMYLILAECYAHEGTLNGTSGSVASVIKSLRDARNFLGAQALPNYATATDAYADVLLERQKELCFEGHRYVDIKRLGTLAGQTILRHITDDQIQSVPLSLANDDYRLTLPIPRAELNANNALQQNPGY